MTALWIILAVLAALFLFSLVRVGTRVRFDEAGLRVQVRFGPVQIQLFPPPKPAKKRKKKSKRPKKKEKPPEPMGGKLELLKQFLPLAAEAAGRLKRKISIDRLMIRLVWGASNPAAAAVGYGRACAVMGMVWPLLEHNFHIRDRDVKIEVSFDRPAPTIMLDAQATLTIGQGGALGFGLGVKTLGVLLKNRKNQTGSQSKKKAVRQA